MPPAERPRCACCAPPVNGWRDGEVTLSIEARYCASCSGKPGSYPCPACGGRALDRALAHADARQEDFFAS